MGVGDEIHLVERKYPQWTIERIQEYLHRDKSNLAKLEELEAIEEFGDECKSAFRRMIAELRKGDKKKEVERWEEFELVEKRVLTKRISKFVLQAVGKGQGEELDPGAFVRLKFPNGLIRPYSIVSGNTNRIELGIALEDDSRGGSRYLHQDLKEGHKIQVGKITESVPISGSSSNHIFIAGGIGITAFLFHIDIYQQINFNYELHYAMRSAEDNPYKELFEKMGTNVRIYDKSRGERMDIPRILENRKWNSFVYVCGPQRMIDASIRAANACGVSGTEIHYEAFQMATSGDPFTVQVKSGKEFKVDAEQTLLQVLREAGFDVDSSCETGNCGTCKVDVCSGKVEHRGSALNEEEKEDGKAMLSCVSRGIGHIVVDF
jgi:ferredoxin-NADP reductase